MYNFKKFTAGKFLNNNCETEKKFFQTKNIKLLKKMKKKKKSKL